jgi:hypothetical protein
MDGFRVEMNGMEMGGMQVDRMKVAGKLLVGVTMRIREEGAPEEATGSSIPW